MRQVLLFVLVIIILIIPTTSFAGDCGDVNNSGSLNISDVTYIINYLYKGGPEPDCGNGFVGFCGDVNDSESINLLDIVYYINYLFKGGAELNCQSYTIPDSTIVIHQSETMVVQNYDTALGTVTLDESSSYAQDVAVGDIIVGQDDISAPNGFLRKVTSKTVQSGSVILETGQATIMEAFESMDIAETHQLLPSDVVSYKLHQGTTFIRNKDGETFAVDLNCVLYDMDGDLQTTGDQIRLDGEYSFTAALFAEIGISWFTLNKFETGILTNQDVNVDLIASLQWEFNEELEFDLAEFHMGAIPIGGVVWLVPTLTVEAHIHGDLTVTFQTGITYTQQLKYGFGWANDEFYNISEGSKEYSYTPPQFTAEFNFEPGVSLNASCLIYGVAGPYMAGKAGFHFQSTLNTDPYDRELTFDLEAILYAVTGIECDILGLDYNYQWQLYTHFIGEWVYPLSGTVTDIDGNVYQTIKIGDQWWMAENLKVTHYRNSDPIPHVTDGGTWSYLFTGAYCEYDNNPANVAIYGRLYNWYAVGDSRNIAPEGWHVPSDDEWKQLEM